MLRGVLAAALTPLRDDGAAVDDAAFGPYTDFLAAGGLDGVLALGTTGEGILLTVEERRRELDEHVVRNVARRDSSVPARIRPLRLSPHRLKISQPPRCGPVSRHSLRRSSV